MGIFDPMMRQPFFDTCIILLTVIIKSVLTKEKPSSVPAADAYLYKKAKYNPI